MLMRKLVTIQCLLIMFWAAPSAAQPDQASPKQDQAALINQITTLRLSLERIADAYQIVVTQRDDTARRHEVLAVRIRKAKALRPKDGLLPEYGLQKMLRQSKELSDSLTLLNRELKALRQARQDRLEQLLIQYEMLVVQAAARLRSTDGALQTDLLGVLEQARLEREAVRRQLIPEQSSDRPAKTLVANDVLSSDDPEELAERADAVRDEQDRLRHDLALLDQRVKHLAADRRLDQEMRDFISDQEMFDEGSRLLVVPRPSGQSIESDDSGPSTTAPDSNDKIDEPEDPSLGGGDDGADLDGEPAGAYSDDPNEGAGWSDPASALADPSDAIGQAGGGSLPVGLDDGADRSAGIETSDDLPTIQRKRTALIERLKKLQILHDRLQEKIEDLSE
jgi:hypothetical protein